MSSNGRLRFFVYYNNQPKLLDDVLKLGAAYVPKESSQADTPEKLKYQASQRLQFSSLPTEIQFCIYEHMYSSSPTIGAHIIIRRGTAYREFRPGVDSVRDDDTVVEFPHCLADRFVSVGWLCDNITTMAKRMHCHVDDYSWPWTFSLVNSKPCATGTQRELAETVLSAMLCEMPWMRLNIDRGRTISQTFNADHCGVFKNLGYVQMTHNDWWNELYFIRNSHTAEPEIVSLRDTALSTVREQVLYVDRDAANLLTSTYAKSIYRFKSDINFTDGMCDAVHRWAADNEAYQDLQKVFEDWDGTEDMKNDSEFIVRGIRIELDGGLLLDILEVDSDLPAIEEVVEEVNAEARS
ncbi:hypothetical protein H2198_007648 [Neophaeococcomyces mojaviensis]|uniref:Uncharacterized protein n=1 Tax=Neophaeococcomyces mojaviensis TaxID=3383035 RepID=A0ACC2ZZN9_9EURO|nr:hypothetical protein H2198_007648 [Knufia sp. JES_112]